MDDPAVDRLYGLPLEDFVAERDALAKQRRADGDRAAAQAIKALAKPSRAAWAVNRLVRARPEEIAALVQAGEALEGAQERVLAGEADADALRSAAEAARALVDALVAEAEVAGEAAREKVRATLHAATVDPEVRREVAAGRVVRERSAAAFGGLDVAVATARRRRPASPARPASPTGPRRPSVRERERAERAERQARRRRDALRRACEAEAAAEADVDGARRALEQVEATLAARRRDLDAAERALSAARSRRERAEREAAEG